MPETVYEYSNTLVSWKKEKRALVIWVRDIDFFSSSIQFSGGFINTDHAWHMQLKAELYISVGYLEINLDLEGVGLDLGASDLGNFSRDQLEINIVIT